MSEELTEKWKNGTLNGGWYFLKFENCSILPVYYCGFNREFEFGWDWKISKVLAPVSYHHFVELTEKANQFPQMVKKVKNLEKENAELKMLFEECGEEFNRLYCDEDFSSDYYAVFVNRINEVLK